MSSEAPPYLICKATKKYEDGEYTATINNKIFIIGNNAEEAFDILYKTLYILDIEKKPLTKFFNFFDKIVYKIKKGKGLGVVRLFIKNCLLIN
jgi:hypothetical protein